MFSFVIGILNIYNQRLPLVQSSANANKTAEFRHMCDDVEPEDDVSMHRN